MNEFQKKKAQEFLDKARLEHLKHEAEKQKEIQKPKKKLRNNYNKISKIWE